MAIKTIGGDCGVRDSSGTVVSSIVLADITGFTVGGVDRLSTVAINGNRWTATYDDASITYPAEVTISGIRDGKAGSETVLIQDSGVVTTFPVFTPADGTTFAGASQVFTAADLGGDLWGVSLYSSSDYSAGSRFFNSGTLVSEGTNITATGIPSDDPVYARFSVGDGVNAPQTFDYTFSGQSTAGSVSLLPASGTTFTSSSQTFTIQNLPSGELWGLSVYTASDFNVGSRIYNSGNLIAGPTINASGLSTSGIPLYVRVSVGDGVNPPALHDFNYVAHTATGGSGTINVPTVSAISEFPDFAHPSGQGNTTNLPNGAVMEQVTGNSGGTEYGHLYSRTNTFSRDGQRMLLRNYGGSQTAVLNRADNSISTISMTTAANFSVTTNNYVIGKQGSVLAGLDVVTNTTTLYKLGGNNITVDSVGDGEGTQSTDDGVIAISDGGNIKVYDISNPASCSLLATISKPADYNWASVTPSGEYVLIESNVSGANVQKVYTKTGSFLFDITHPNGNSSHGDVCLDVNGADCFACVGKGRPYWVNLATQNYYVWTASQYVINGHLAGSAVDAPGWQLLTSNNVNASGELTNNDLFALRAKPSTTPGSISGLTGVTIFEADMTDSVAHIASSLWISNDYASLPMSSVNRDFTLVAVKSPVNGGILQQFVVDMT